MKTEEAVWALLYIAIGVLVGGFAAYEATVAATRQQCTDAGATRLGRQVFECRERTRVEPVRAPRSIPQL